MIDLIEQEYLSFSWPELTYAKIDCPIDSYRVRCTDSTGQQYSLGYDKEVMIRTSAICAGFEYNLISRTVSLPLITTPNSEFEGKFTFIVHGANSVDLDLESDPFI